MSARSTTVGGGGPCGACRFLRRKCVEDCLFAPYFPPETGVADFVTIHRVIGSSNFARLLQQVPHDKRLDTAATVHYEAQARLQDPVYGSVAKIIALESQIIGLEGQVADLQQENARLQARVALLEHQFPPLPSFPVAAASLPATSGFAPSLTVQQPGMYQQHESGGRHVGAPPDLPSPTQSDFEMLAQALLDDKESPLIVDDAMMSHD